jgi:hypothetical protein
MVTPFAPLRLIDGYLPIEDHGLIGDGTTAALIVRVLQGRVRVRIEVEPLGGIRAERHAGGFQLRCETDPERDLWLFSTGPLEGLRTVRELKAGDHLYLMLRCG